MRTTITLDDDIAEKLHSEMRRRSTNFKETLNDVLRRGLLARRELAAVKPFKVRGARRLGNKPGLNYDNIGELLEQLEGSSHK
jgi:hypothetical protein